MRTKFSVRGRIRIIIVVGYVVNIIIHIGAGIMETSCTSNRYSCNTDTYYIASALPDIYI